MNRLKKLARAQYRFHFPTERQRMLRRAAIGALLGIAIDRRAMEE